MLLRLVFWKLNTAGEIKMKNTVVGVLLALSVLASAPLAYSYQVDRDVLLTYGDTEKNYTETYFDEIVQGLDTNSLTDAILTVYLNPAVTWKWPSATIWVNGDEVQSNLLVEPSTAWTYDVLNQLQNDGGLTFKVEKRSGTVYYLGAALDVQDSAAQNPLPGTLWLFGCGLIAFVGLRRRFEK